MLRLVKHTHQGRPDLQELVDEEKLDDLLRVLSLDEVAAAWRCYQERAAAGEYVDFDDADWWAVEFWLSGAPVYRRQETARAGLLALVHAVPDELLGDVGAGPLENFISPQEDVVRWVEDAAQNDARFRTALGFVYLTAEEPWVFERLRRVLDDPDQAL